jgi:hypothetical protein
MRHSRSRSRAIKTIVHHTDLARINAVARAHQTRRVVADAHHTIRAFHAELLQLAHGGIDMLAAAVVLARMDMQNERLTRGS